jgi:excinuclease UvrABC ATPase subunit
MKGEIEIVGARTNNLRSVDADIPLRKATMLVGVSGSGKSSLLADTLAAEANARMRRFLGVHQPHLADEDVPAYVGPLPACVHFSQGAFRASRRTTVATSSGLLALLRSYFRRYSKPWAEEVGEFVPPPSASSYGGWIRGHYTGPLTVWTVVARWERTDGARAAKLLLTHGVKRATVRSETDTAARAGRGREVELEKFKPLSANVKHLIEAEVGKATASKAGDELPTLLKRAFDIGGDVIVEFHQAKELPEELHGERGVLLDNTQHWVHPEVLLPFAPPSDALLSFNSPSNPRRLPGLPGAGQGAHGGRGRADNSPRAQHARGCLLSVDREELPPRQHPARDRGGPAGIARLLPGRPLEETRRGSAPARTLRVWLGSRAGHRSED